MKIIDCTFIHLPEIQRIFNEEIINTTAIYDYKPRSLDVVSSWFESKEVLGFPVVGILTEKGELAGFGSYGTFRTFPAYKYSVEHSIYVRKDQRKKGVGKALLEELLRRAEEEKFHTLIGGIDSKNEESIRLHEKLGFVECARIEQVGYKFGKWLDLLFYQKILRTPENPVEG